MERIRKAQLEHLIARINLLAGMPEAAYRSTKDSMGNAVHRANVGHIFLNRQYGGYSLARMANEEGGEYHLGHAYLMTAREAWMTLRGIEAALEMVKNIREGRD